jgi:hypothetical protein
MKLTAVLLLLAASFAAFAQTPISPRTFAARSPTIPCEQHDTAAGADLMPLDGSNNWAIPPAATTGEVPPAFGITQVCLTHSVYGDQVGSHSTAGKSGPNGDLLTPITSGSGTWCAVYNPPNQFVPGEYLDVHASCVSGFHWVSLHVTYVPAPGSAAAAPGTSVHRQAVFRGQWVTLLNGSRVGDSATVRFPDGREVIVKLKDLQ